MTVTVHSVRELIFMFDSPIAVHGAARRHRYRQYQYGTHRNQQL
ncbi:hypothetical protein [Duncaniella freteri]|nr:hypothetical protein [Duncaniella freteri]